jgi:phosphoribosylanthranilate isomerase
VAQDVSRVRVKVCCIASVAEARAAVAAGADALGLVSAMPSGPGPIPDELIARIAATVPPGVDSFLLTCAREPQAVVDQVARCGTSVVQLVDAVPDATYAALRRHCPGRRIVQVVHVEDAGCVPRAERVATLVDALLLDSGSPGAEAPQLGGTGRCHDWNLSANIVARVGIPVYLAGGLDAENVTGAIARVRPFGVDLCSGVRTAERLDRAKLARFMSAVAQAGFAD